MSLLQEIEIFGLADCEFNRQLSKIDRRINRLLKIYLPVFNDHLWAFVFCETIEGDFCEPLNEEQARESGFFIHWCGLWDDRRRELSQLLKDY